eukprot:4028489-Pyramimonas_sp.AAC.1
MCIRDRLKQIPKRPQRGLKRLPRRPNRAQETPNWHHRGSEGRGNGGRGSTCDCMLVAGCEVLEQKRAR